MHLRIGLVTIFLLNSICLLSQEKPLILNLSGIIRNEKNEPLPFVKVIIKNKKKKIKQI